MMSWYLDRAEQYRGRYTVAWVEAQLDNNEASYNRRLLRALSNECQQDALGNP